MVDNSSKLDIILQNILNHLVLLPIGLLIWLLIDIVKKIAPLFASNVLPHINREILMETILLQFLIILILLTLNIILFFRLKKKPKIEIRGPLNHYRI